MRYLFTITLLVCYMISFPQKPAMGIYSPLALYDAEWQKPVYAKCNTALRTDYMSQKEKDIIYILNLIRFYPRLFVNSVLKKYPERSRKKYLLDNAYYFKSLLDTLSSLAPLGLLYPDRKCFTSAQCHAITSGKDGYDGHDRLTDDCEKKRYYNGECCDYGHRDALDIVLSLLIDESVPSLGHRTICLGNYSKIAVSVQPHIYWNYTAVLDFHY